MRCLSGVSTESVKNGLPPYDWADSVVFQRVIGGFQRARVAFYSSECSVVTNCDTDIYDVNTMMVGDVLEGEVFAMQRSAGGKPESGVAKAIIEEEY